MIETVWFWVPRADNPHCRYGDPQGLVVGTIVGKVTQTDVTIKITHSVHPRYPVGTTCRRCRMKTRDAVLVDGVPIDKQTKKEIMPSEPKVREIPSAGNEDASFSREKYRVIKDTVAPEDIYVDGHFVLMPEKDPAALQALRSYAALCRSPGMQKMLLEWIRRIEQEIVPLWQKGEHLGSMGRINAGLDRLI